MKANMELQKNVQNAIKWEPILHSAEIRITAKDGIVFLTGTVDSYVKKIEAENVTKKIIGVKVIADNIKVKLPKSNSKTDNEITTEILAAFRSNPFIPHNMIKVIVEDGQVILEGELQWDYQREIIKNAICYLPGIKNIINNIKIKSEIQNAIKQQDIENAFRINWMVRNCNIHVTVYNVTVTLSGSVDSWYQKDEAERIAWKSPGIEHVINNIFVDFDLSKHCMTI